MLQPHLTQQRIVATLVEHKLPAPSKTRVNLSMLVEVGGMRPGAVAVVQVQDTTFAKADKKTDIATASEKND